MDPIIILYATATGMTQDVATRLQEQISRELPDHQFSLVNVRDITPSQLKEHKLILFGTSSWDHGIPCPDGEAFMHDLIKERPDLTGVSFALFGLGDSAYEEFCGALPLIQEDLEDCGAYVDSTHFTIDGFANQKTIDELVAWATRFLNERTS